MKKRTKILIAAAVLVVAILIIIRIVSSGKGGVPQVAVTSPERKTIRNTLTVSGPVSGTDSVDVVSNLHAEVLEILVSEGDKVKQGQVIAVLDDTDLRKEVEIARNEYDLAVSTCEEMNRDARNGYAKAVQDYKTAKANFDRTQVLFDGGSVPRVDLEAAQNALNDAARTRDSFIIRDGQAVAGDSYRLQIEKARFAYEKANEQLADTQITAPIDGTVVRVNTKVGRFADKVEDDEPMFIIENLDVLEMEIAVSEYSIGKVAVGQGAEISADILNGVPAAGEVVSISPTGEEKAGGSNERVIPTTIRIFDDNTKLIAGITARAKIVLEEKEDALTIPMSALLAMGEENFVQTVQDGTVHWIPVEIGVESDTELEILPIDETVDETTQILITPDASFTEGMAVSAPANAA